MYTYRQIGHRYIVSIDNHTEIVEALQAFCLEKSIFSGTISGIGAVGEATLRLYDPATRQYRDRTFNEQMEVANLTGNIAQMEDKPYLHLHITLGRTDYTALAGHLLSARINGAGEFVIDDFETTVERRFDPEIGLNCYDFVNR